MTESLWGDQQRRSPNERVGDVYLEKDASPLAQGAEIALNTTDVLRYQRSHTLTVA